MASNDFIDNAISSNVDESAVSELASSLENAISNPSSGPSTPGPGGGGPQQRMIVRTVAGSQQPPGPPQQARQQGGPMSNIIRTASGQMVMTGGQRLVGPGGQVLVARPQGGQQVQLQGGQIVQQQGVGGPGQQQQLVRTSGGQQILVGGAQQRPVGGQMVPGGQQIVRQTQPQVAGGAGGQQQVQRVVINQPGIRPGQPGSQITVPLSTLQALQAGQGIPTGQPGHLLVKTETGQYQILRVGPPGAGGQTTAVPTSAPTPVSLPQHPGGAATVQRPGQQSASQAPSPQQGGVVRPNPVMRPTPPPQVRLPTAPLARQPPAAQASPQPPPGPQVPPPASSNSSVGNNSMGTQMTPDTAKIKCKNFLATLLRLASDQPESVARNVRALIQGLIDGRVEPEVFTTKLQKELNSSPQPCLVPFLKKSLPYLQHSLATRELTIEGVNPPTISQVGKLPPAVTSAGPAAPTPALGGRPPSLQAPPTAVRHPPSAVTQLRTPLAASSLPPQAALRTGVSNVSSFARPGGFPGLPTTPLSRPQAYAGQGVAPGSLGGGHPSLLPAPKAPAVVVRDKKAGNAYSAAGDDDINDVAAMGGVNLAEEANRILGSTDNVGTVVRSCKDETFLQTGLLHQRISRICREKGLEAPPPEVISLVSHATQDRLKSLVAKLSVVAEHRLDIIKTEGQYEVTQDIRGQLRFLEDLDKMEKKRHEEAEREMLLRAAKSRTKTDDPEKEKMKAKAKEIQRIEQETLRHQEANRTALEAIGGPKKRKFGEIGGTGGGAGDKMGGVSSSNAVPMRPRTKRVHLRDVLFLMEQEKDLKHSNLLFKSYCS